MGTQRQAIHIKPGYPHTLSTDKVSGVGLQHYALELDRGLSYAAATALLEAKAAASGGERLRGEGFWRGADFNGQARMVVLLQRPVTSYNLKSTSDE